MGFMVWPLTVRGVTWEGSRLSLWSPSSSTMSVPATEMSAPESGRALTVAEPFGLAMCTSMVGADSMCRAPWAFPVALGLVREVATDTALVDGPASLEGVAVGSVGLRDLQVTNLVACVTDKAECRALLAATWME